MYHGNVKICWLKNLLLLPLLIIVFLHQNFFIVYELDLWPWNLNSDFTLGDCLFWGVELAKYADPDKSVFSAYGIGFDTHIKYSLLDNSVGKNPTILGADMSSSVKGKKYLDSW